MVKLVLMLVIILVGVWLFSLVIIYIILCWFLCIIGLVIFWCWNLFNLDNVISGCGVFCSLNLLLVFVSFLLLWICNVSNWVNWLWFWYGSCNFILIGFVLLLIYNILIFCLCEVMVKVWVIFCVDIVDNDVLFLLVIKCSKGVLIVILVLILIICGFCFNLVVIVRVVW